MIVVTSGCQSAGISAALAGMLPGTEVRPVVPAPEDPTTFHGALARATIWVTSLPVAETSALADASRTKTRIVRIPNIYFHAFHPDILHVAAPDGSALGSGAGEYSSAVLVYGWKLRWRHDELRRAFSASVYDRLGYSSVWAGAVQIMRQRFDASDVDFAGWYLPLVRRGTFMLTDNHPTVGALVQLARQVGVLLGASPELVAFPWEHVVPDGLLATSTVWPVYPELATRLGVAGGYVWRGVDGTVMDLDGFIERSLDRYRDIDPDAVQSPRFDDSPQYANVLGRNGSLAELR